MEPPPSRCSICRLQNPRTTCTGCVCKDYFTEGTKGAFIAISNLLGGESRVRDELEPLDTADAFFWIHRKLKLVAGNVEDATMAERMTLVVKEISDLKLQLEDTNRRITILEDKQPVSEGPRRPKRNERIENREDEIAAANLAVQAALGGEDVVAKWKKAQP